MVIHRVRCCRWPAKVRASTVSPMTCSAREGRTLRPLASVVAAVAAALVLAGCGGDSKPTVHHSSSPTSLPPSPSPSAWESKYTPKQMADFREALQRYMDFLRRSEPIYAKGKATKASMALFKEYFLDPDGQQIDLQNLERNHIRVKGLPKILWSRPTRVKGGSVTIAQCVDNNTPGGIYRAGKLLPRKPNFPYIDTVTLDRLEGGGDFFLEPFQSEDPDKAKRCHA